MQSYLVTHVKDSVVVPYCLQTLVIKIANSPNYMAISCVLYLGISSPFAGVSR